MAQETQKQSEKPYDLDPNVEAALSYLISPITGVVVFLLEKKNKFVRFHAMQSILFGAAFALVFMVLIPVVAVIPLIGVILAGFLAPVLSI